MAHRGEVDKHKQRPVGKAVKRWEKVDAEARAVESGSSLKKKSKPKQLKSSSSSLKPDFSRMRSVSDTNLIHDIFRSKPSSSSKPSSPSKPFSAAFSGTSNAKTTVSASNSQNPSPKGRNKRSPTTLPQQPVSKATASKVFELWSAAILISVKRLMLRALQRTPPRGKGVNVLIPIAPMREHESN